MATNGCEEHFRSPPTRNFEGDEPRFQRSKTGRCSPTHSAHGCLMRTSLFKLSAEKKAKKVRFYRNGDKFHKGLVYAISPERFRTFEALLADLTRALVDQVNLPHGARVIFALDGHKVTSLEHLEEGQSYVCASTDCFKKIDYIKNESPSWNVNKSKQSESNGTPKAILAEQSNKDFIRPKLITVIRNGIKPRKAVRILLNKKTAHSFDQVLSDVTDAIKLDTGAVRKLFTLDGRQVMGLADLFNEDDIFIAYGPEKYSHDDFDLDSDEFKAISPYAKSPIPARKNKKKTNYRSMSPSCASDASTGRGTDSASCGSPLGSPRMSRKFIKSTISNGHNGHISPQIFRCPTQISATYEVGRIIGDGNFAVVRECVEKASGKEFALKIIDKDKCRGKEHMIESEVSILRCVKHPNIVLLVEEYNFENELYLVMELVKGGDLFDHIASTNKHTERDASSMVYDLSSALKYLHMRNIVHRDIKPENLLVLEGPDGSKTLKLGDFGLAVEYKVPLFTVCGTPTYVAPEILAESGYGPKVDVWAAGVITYILLCGFPPFVSQTNNQEELFDLILSGQYEFTSPYWDDISNSAKELITHMLQVDPDNRFSAAQVLSHPWVSDDSALNNDRVLDVSSQLGVHFDTKSKSSHKSAGIALIASTALDKQNENLIYARRGVRPPGDGAAVILSVGEPNGQHDEVF
ncbi:Serine/threonine-protein kinase dclk1 [Chamberlinius hualienensis]